MGRLLGRKTKWNGVPVSVEHDTELEFRLQVGLSSPHVTTLPRRSESTVRQAAARRRAPQPRADPEGRARRLRRPGDRRPDRRRRQAREGRRRHRLPPLPDQGGAARRARARALRGDRRLRARGARARGRVGGLLRADLARRRAQRRRPRVLRGRRVHRPEPTSSSEIGLRALDQRADGARARRRARCAPTRPRRDIADDDVRRRLGRCAHEPVPDAWRRYLTLMLDGLRAS